MKQCLGFGLLLLSSFACKPLATCNAGEPGSQCSYIYSIIQANSKLSSLVYKRNNYNFIQNFPITTATPAITGIATSCESTPALPAGLALNPTNCAISGAPANTQNTTAYTITAMNFFGNVQTNISINTIAQPTGLVARYDFSGNALDTSGNGFNLTTNTATLTTDRNNQPSSAYNFVPPQTMFEPFFMAQTTNITLSVWVRWAGSNGAAQYIVYNGDAGAPGSGSGFFIDGNGVLNLISGNVVVYSTAYSFPQNVWTHVSMTIDSSLNYTAYINGVSVYTVTGLSPNALTVGNVFIVSGYYTGASQQFNGDIDDVKVYSRSLTAAEILALSN